MKNTDRNSRGINKFYLVCGVIICLCAIAEFIIWIVDASKLHETNQIVLGSGLLAITVGALWYLLMRRRSYAAANGVLWFTIIGAIVCFIVGVALTPSSQELGAIYGG